MMIVKQKRRSGKPVLILFLLTGILSMGLWWRGGVLHGTESWWKGLTGEMSFVVPTSPAEQVSLGASRNKEKLLVNQLQKLVATASGEYAVYIYDLQKKTGFGFNENKIMPAASIMKLPVFVVVRDLIEKGNLKLTDQYTLEEADRSTGSGPLQFKLAGTRYTVDELLNYLGKNSDNTAWVMFNRRLGKKEMEAALAKTGASDSSYQNLEITAVDTAKIWEYLYPKTDLHKYLVDSIYEDRIPLGVPEEGVKIVHKVGTDVGVWADSGIIFSTRPFVLVILNKEVVREEAMKLVPEVTKMVYSYENSLLH